MAKNKIVNASKQVKEIINKVEFKKKSKKVKKQFKEKINNFKSKDPSLLASKKEEKKVKHNPNKIMGNIKKVKENIAIRERVEGIKKKKKKIKNQILDKLGNNKNEDMALVTPKKNKNNKKLKNKKPKEILGNNIKNFKENIAGNDKILKIKKLKSKKDTQHLLENEESSSFTTPVKKRQKTNKNLSPKTLQKRKKQLEKLEEFVSGPAKRKPALTLRQKMMEKLEAARFRFLNEQIYTTNGKEAEKLFKADPTAFQAYHKGFRQQVNRWPMNPLDKVINMIKKMPQSLVVADFGCGDAKLAHSVPHKVHSFDLVAANDRVTACNMAHVPLENDSVDVAVFCLSLMGTNLKEYLIEVNRVLKSGGLLKVVEVESRFDNVDDFITACKSYGFVKSWMDLSHNLFYFLDFKKTTNVKKDKKKLPEISLKPCIYKKR